MKAPSLLNCLLIGALASSLAFNIQTALADSRVETPIVLTPTPVDCCPEVASEIPDSHGLSSSELQAITAQCVESCSRSSALYLDAEGKLTDIWAAVADPNSTWAEVHDMVEDTVRLRGESLMESVHTAFEVRETLPHEWMKAVFKKCQEHCIFAPKSDAL